MTQKYDEDYWNERYGKHGNIWSGDPNPQLVAEAAELTPGTALDVGCGEGADTVWLAARGWQVTGVDISMVALQRATAHVADRGLANMVTLEHHDLLSWAPPAASFDLVSAQFMHLPQPDREPLFARLAESVAPGGTLLIVGHAPSDIESGAHRPHAPDLFFTAGEVADSLPADAWRIIVTATRPRPSAGHGGEHITIHDEVMRAVRLG